MRVGVIQSAYAPWRGYFEFIAGVDLFVLYDDVQFSKGSWQNRNRFRTAAGTKWLTVPVASAGKPAIDEVRISEPHAVWRQRHERFLEAHLGDAPHAADTIGLWRSATAAATDRLSVVNERLIRAVCERLGVTTRIVQSRPYGLSGAKTERLIGLLRKLEATCYVSGPAAKGYLDERMFADAGIRLEYKSYDYAPYLQLHGGFDGAVSVLDLIANVGPNAASLLRSRTPNEVAVP